MFRTGPYVGVTADWLIGLGYKVDYSFQFGLHYFNRGNKVQFKDEKTYREYDIKSHYITFPLMANARYFINDDFNLYANGGLYMGFRIEPHHERPRKDFMKMTSEEWRQELKERDDWDNSVGQLEPGLQLGAGVEYRRVMLSVGYHLSFTRYMEDRIYPDIYGIQVLLGYRF